MSYYVFFHFKSDIVPHINTLPPSPPPAPAPIWLPVFVSFSTLNLLLSTHIFLPFRPPHISPLLSSMVLCLSHFLSSTSAITMISFICTMLCFHCLSLPFFPPLSCLLCPNHTMSCQSLCVRGHCFGFRRPAHCRRQSTRQGHGVRIRCSLGTGCTSCPGPPIARTCCMSMPPGKTSNRAKLPLTTSEGASHCPG